VTRKPTNEKLGQRIKVLEAPAVNSKQTEDALRKSKEAYQSLFDDHAAVKLVIDPDTGAIVTANRAAATFYGWSRKTLAQMNIQQINTLPLDKIKETMKDASDQKLTHFEFQHRLADGSVRDVEVFSNRITIDGHEYLHSIIHDITNLKRTELEKTIIAEIGRIIGSSLNIDEVYERFTGPRPIVPVGGGRGILFHWWARSMRRLCERERGSLCGWEVENRLSHMIRTSWTVTRQE
jgi:PAS domain S-box-containing protein